MNMNGLDSRTMDALTALTADVMKIAELAGAEGIERLHTEAKAILGTVLTDGVTALTAVEIEMASKLGSDVGELRFGKAREKSIEKAWSALSPDEASVLRMLDGDHADPRTTVAAKSSAERELVGLSSIVRGELARRCAGDPLMMLSVARTEGLLG